MLVMAVSVSESVVVVGVVRLRVVILVTSCQFCAGCMCVCAWLWLAWCGGCGETESCHFGNQLSVLCWLHVCVCLVVAGLVWWLHLHCYLDFGFGCCCACSNFGCCRCNGVGFRYFNDYGCALMLKSVQQFTYAGCPDGFCFGLSQFADGTHINDSIWRECVHQ